MTTEERKQLVVQLTASRPEPDIDAESLYRTRKRDPRHAGNSHGGTPAMKHGGQWRDFEKQVGPSHKPYQDLWTVMSVGTFIESKVCTKREDVLRTVERMDKTQPVLVSYLGQPAHIHTPLGDGAWDGE